MLMSPTTNPSSLISNHYHLIIECCRHEPDPLKLESLAELITDWNGCLTSAYAHGVYPLVAKSLKSISTVPESIKHTLKITNLDIARRNMMMTSELLRIMKLLEDSGINALAIKGPVLSQIIHGDVTSRQYADIDILLSEEDLEKAVLKLNESGYVSDQPIKFLKNKKLLAVLKDFVLYNKSGSITVEIHWKLFLEHQIKHLVESGIVNVKNKINVEINNTKIDSLENNTNFLYLILHGSKHLWERIEWLVDIDRMVRKYDFNLEAVVLLIDDIRTKKMILLGIIMCHELFNTPFTKTIINIARKENLDEIKTLIINNIINDKILEEQTAHDCVQYIFEEENKVSWSKQFYRILKRLDPSDIYTVNLPESLSSLYHLIHIYNLILRSIAKK